ncbi:MAG: antibiotic biosynthesis monooxygenase [Lentisphaeria bacterium]|nr:antibiotic biosynthesis monooxygenase [Lentisphaeria bacterium]
MLHVIARIELVDGAQEKFLEVLEKYIPTVRSEEGCIRYEPCLDIESETRAQFVTIVEEWVDEAHLKKHLATEHMAQYRQEVAPLRKSTLLYKVETA